ncbi:MAG TPA: hypothetical protein P5536_03725 [Methanoregulaceae archaeon]|nr:hypothetical protein [Methanoregulaceae archaeon]
MKFVTTTKREILDTDKDVCLYRSPRPPFEGSKANIRGRDLYIHQSKNKKPVYYFHAWSMEPAETERIIPASTRLVERYLASRGLVCDDLPGAEAARKLMQWGYGILEEF